MRPYVTVEGIGRLDEALGMIALDGFELNPPELRLRTVEIPGRSGSLDLSDALGGPYFENRYQTLRFLIEGDPEKAKSAALVALHGKRLHYTLSVDPDHTYIGRWSVATTEEHFAQGALTMSCEIVADPYRYQKDRLFSLNPAGGRWYVFESGDKPVKPNIECFTPTRVEYAGKVSVIPAGRWRLNDVIFSRGVNQIYLNSWDTPNTTWDYLAASDAHSLSWDEAAVYSWDELGQMMSTDGIAVRAWDDLSDKSWDDLSDTSWDELSWRARDADDNTLPVDTTVTFSYEWGDL